MIFSKIHPELAVSIRKLTWYKSDGIWSSPHASLYRLGEENGKTGTTLNIKLTPSLFSLRAGDGLVAATSAVLPGATHHNIHRNHVGVAFSPGAHQRIVDFLNGALY